MSETTQDQENIRKRILDASEQLFSEKGYDSVSIREITAAADTHVSAVNYHFGSKKELYLEIFRTRWLARAAAKRRSMEKLEQLVDITPELVIKSLAAQFLDPMLPREECFRHYLLARREMSEPTEAFHMILDEHIKPAMNLGGRLMNRALGRELDPEKMKLVLFSILAQLIYFSDARMLVSQLTGRKYNPEFIDDIVNHITEFSLRGLCGECE